MLYTQEQIDEINRKQELEELVRLANNDPDALVVYLPDGKEALIGKHANDFVNGFKSATDFIRGRLNYYNGNLNRLADEMGYNTASPDHFDFVLDVNNYQDDLLGLIKDSYSCENLAEYLGITE